MTATMKTKINDKSTYFPSCGLAIREYGRESDLDIFVSISVVKYLSHIHTCAQKQYVKIGA